MSMNCKQSQNLTLVFVCPSFVCWWRFHYVWRERERDSKQLKSMIRFIIKYNYELIFATNTEKTKLNFKDRCIKHNCAF